MTSGPVSGVVEPRRMSSKPTQRLTWKVKAEIKHEVKQEEHPEMFSLEEHRTSDAVGRWQHDSGGSIGSPS